MEVKPRYVTLPVGSFFFGSVCAGGPNTDETPVGDREGNPVELVHSGKRSQRLLLVTGSVDVD